MRNGYRIEPTPASGTQQSVVRKPRARKRPKDAPTHVRSWPLRPDSAQCRVIRTRFFTGTRVYNAVLSEFLARSRAVKSDPAWETARQMPRRTSAERKASSAAFHSVERAHGFTVDAAQSFASGLRKFWVREHLPAQETQNLGGRAFDAVKGWHLGRKGKPRFKPVSRGLHSLAAKDGNGALRPKIDASGRLVGLQWGAGFVLPIAAPAPSGRRGKEQQAELAEIEALIAEGKVLSTRIVRTVINAATPTACNSCATGTRPGGIRSVMGGCRSILGPVRSLWLCSAPTELGRGGWSRWLIGSVWTPPGCAACSGIWTVGTAPVRRAVSTRTAPTSPVAAPGSVPVAPNTPRRGLPSCTAGWPGTVRRCTARWPTGYSLRVLISRARSWITSRGRRTSRAVCATGHRGCSWR
jgi:hypothetical protein